jgi:RNA ligase
MKLAEILDVDKLEHYVASGYLTARQHPTLPLVIYNYSKSCQYDKKWDDVTIRCRGLIVDDKKNIVGSGFHKFFNYGEPEASILDVTGPIQVTDKVDGSLGIVCFYNKELVVATRGSFESEQAQFAYDLIMRKYFLQFELLCNDDSTALVEIIYPENRIVLDYKNLTDVVLIGVQSNYEHDSKHLWIPARDIYSWTGPKVTTFNVKTLEAALQMPHRPNSEGIVVYFEDTDQRVKIKQSDYIALHKLISNITPKNIWLQLCSGKTIDEIAVQLPDEFYAYVTKIGTQILQQHTKIVTEVMQSFEKILEKLPHSYSRRDFALAANEEIYKSQLFLLLDSRYDAMLDSVWKMVQPKEEI